MTTQTPSTSGLYTTVKNTSGGPRSFGFLGVHGKRLEANESFVQPGDLVAKLGADKYQRKFKSLEGALSRGALTIVSSPAIYLYDEVDDRTKQLDLSHGDLGVVDPAWDPEGSSEFAEA